MVTEIYIEESRALEMANVGKYKIHFFQLKFYFKDTGLPCFIAFALLNFTGIALFTRPSTAKRL